MLRVTKFKNRAEHKYPGFLILLVLFFLMSSKNDGKINVKLQFNSTKSWLARNLALGIRA